MVLLLISISLPFNARFVYAQETPVKENATEANKAAESAAKDRSITPSNSAKTAAGQDRKTLEQNKAKDAATNSSSGNAAEEKQPGWFDSITNAPQTLVRTLLKWISMSVLNIVAYTVSWSGLLLNIVLKITIIDMKKIVDSLTVIDSVWKVVRDFINMLFLFGLLYAAVSHILNVGAGKDLRNVVVHILIGAVFMNFSMVMTKALIDVSNIVTIGLYEQLPGVSITDPNAPGLSNAMMQALKLQTVFEPGIKPGGSSVEAAVASSIADLGIFLISTVMGSILMLIATLLFLTASTLFIVRFVTLLFLITLSPLAFAGWALPFPEIKKHSKMWWDKLTQHLTFPITYMLLLWISFKILVGDCTDSGECTGNITRAMGVDGLTFIDSFTDLGVKTIGIGLNYFVVIGFMFFSLTTAVEAGIPTAKLGQGAISKLLKGTQDGVTGYIKNRTGSAMRDTAGRAASAMQNSQTMKALQSRAPNLGNKLYDVTGKVADAKFGTAKSYTSAVKEKAERAAQGYKQASTAAPLTRRILESEAAFKARKEAEEARAIERGKRYANEAMGKTLLGSKKLASATNFVRGTSGEQESISAAVKKATKETKGEERKLANKRELKDALAEIDPAIRMTKVRQVINKMNTSEITSVEVDDLKKPEVIAALKDSHFDAIDKADATVFTEEEKAAIKQVRYREFTDAVAGVGGLTTGDAIDNMTEATLQGINIDRLSDTQKRALFATSSMSSSRFLAFLKSPNLKPSEKREIKDYRYDVIDNRPATPTRPASTTYNAANIPTVIGEMNDEEIAGLDNTILVNPAVIPHLTVSSLNKMLEKNVSSATRNAIRTVVQGTNAGNAIQLGAWLATPAGQLF